jgi:hypothetical protein
MTLSLLEAALRRVGAPIELGLHLVDAAVGIRIGRLPGRLGLLVALEQRADLLRHALVLAHQTLLWGPAATLVAAAMKTATPQVATISRLAMMCPPLDGMLATL